MAWLSGGWGQRIEITVSNTNIGSDLTHFPLLLTLGASVGTGADDISAIFDELTSDANRLKIAVTESDGTTEIKVEIEDWDDASETAHLWVAASGLTLSASATTTLFIYYDSTHADNTANVGDVASAAGEAVWDSDYVLVAHLSETTGTHLDSTSNDNDESAKSITDQDVAGQIGGGDNFLEDHVQFTNTGMIVGAGTMQCWFQEDVDPSTRDDFIMSHRNGSTDSRVYARTNSGVLTTRYHADVNSVSLGDIPAGWNHVAVSWSGADWFTNFNDNTQASETAAAQIVSVAGNVQIGTYIDLGTGQNLDGDIDEFRLSSILRSDDWLQADWHSATDNLVSYGSEELEPVGETAELPSATLTLTAFVPQAVTTESANITAVTPSEFDFDNTDVDIIGTDFEATQNTGQVWISDASTLAGSANEVEIDGAINTWADALVNLDFSGLSQAEIDALHTLGPSASRWIILENDSGQETSFQITLHRPQAFQMVAGLLVPGVTTSRLTGMTGPFGGGRAEETAAQNPSTTDTDVAFSGRREDLFSIEAKPNSVTDDQYDFRVLYDGAAPDTITQTPQVTVSEGETAQLPATTLTLTPNVPQAVTTENHIAAVAVAAALVITAFVPTVETFDPNTAQTPDTTLTLTPFVPTAVSTDNHFAELPSATLTLTANVPQAVTTENHLADLPSVTLTLTANVPQAVTEENHLADLPSAVLTLAPFVPQAVTTDAQIAELPSQTLTLTANAPQAVTSEGHLAQTPATTLTLTPFVPQSVTTEKHIADLATAVLTLTANVPQAVTTENNFAQTPAITLTLTPFVPQAVTIEKHIAELPQATLTLTPTDMQAITSEGANEFANINVSAALVITNNAPQAVTTEKHIVELPSATITLTANVPQSIVSEIAELPSQTLTLAPFVPQAVTTENRRADLATQVLTLAPFVPQAVTTENHTAELPATTLTLTANVPQAVTTEKHIAQLGTATLTLTRFEMLAIVAARNFAELPAATLTLTANVPQAVTTENNLAQAPSATLTLTPFVPTVETFDPNTGQLGTAVLTLTANVPQAVSTDSNFAELPSQTLTLTPFVPQAVTTEKHIASLPSIALSLTPFVPTVVTLDPNTAQLGTAVLTLTPNAPNAIVSELAAIGTAAALVITPNVPLAVTSDVSIAQLPAAVLTLTAFAPSAFTVGNDLDLTADPDVIDVTDPRFLILIK